MTISTSLFCLKGKTILVTGGTGLVGKALVEGLLNAGAIAYVVGRKAGNFSFSSHPNAHFIELDLSIEDSIEFLFQRIESEPVRFHGVVHGAVFRPGQSSLEDLDKHFLDSINENLRLMHALWSYFSRKMAEQGFGSLLGINSIYGIVAPDFRIYDGTEMSTEPDYPVIKASMSSMSKYYASKYGNMGVRSNTIVLGGVYNNQPTSFVDKMEARIPLGRMAIPDDCVGPAIFLLSDASNYITGCDLPVEGGYLIQ